MKTNKSFRYISISHKRASVTQRGKYHISEEEKDNIIKLIRNTFSDISGLLLLATCNRTEIYFESETTTSLQLRDFLISFKEENNTELSKKLFELSNSTRKTMLHLLEVSSGLRSSVLGDAEIIHQIKKAYHISLNHQLQGSLLERAMQSAFRNHKRLNNETQFRDGTTSVAYKSLKLASDIYGKVSARSKKILFIGAGDIVKQLFKYNSKFNFNSIYISNRTEERAVRLSKKNNCEVLDWDKVLTNDFQDFDVIISAVSNCKHLITKLPKPSSKVLLIDLAIPENIDKKLTRHNNISIYDLDAISTELEETRKNRLAAIDSVNTIIKEELLAYNEWFKKASLRSFLAKYKIIIYNNVKHHLANEIIEFDHETVKKIADRVLRNLIKNPEIFIQFENMNQAITEQISVAKETTIC